MAKAWMGLALALLGAGCNDKVEDTGGGLPALSIDSPDDGAWFDEGDPIEFAVSARRADGTTVAVDGATWTSSEGWTATGASFTATDVPAGNHDITVEASLEGHTLVGSVSIAVWAAR